MKNKETDLRDAGLALGAAADKFAEAEAAVGAAKEDIRRNGRAHAGPLLAAAWKTLGEARGLLAQTREIVRACGEEIPAMLEARSYGVWQSLSRADMERA